MIARSVTHASFTIVRQLKAPCARVFGAFADQATKDAWFGGGDEWKRLRREFDFREGGHEIAEGQWKTGIVTLFDCHYHDIVAPTDGAGRIIYSYSMFVGGTKISVSQTAIEIHAEGSGTRLVFTEYGDYLDGYEDAGSRERGTNGLVDALAKFVEA